MKQVDFLELHESLGTPEHVKRHCMAVGDAAVNICAALTGAGVTGLNGDAVRVAGFLHDMARAEKDHDIIGSEKIKGLLKDSSIFEPGLPDETQFLIVDIVARHMRLDLPDTLDGIDSAAVVALADRITKEDKYVGYKARMEDLRKRFYDVPELVNRVDDNMDRTLSLIAQIEEITGRTIIDIAGDGRIDISPLLPKVERPGRYIGGEMGSIKKEWAKTPFRFCFAFPDLYEIGMSYTGMQIIYGLLNSRQDALCERVFAPANDMARLLEEKGLPLFSLESRKPLSDFDMVGFTLQYELCYTNVVRMLGQAGIPLYADDRSDTDPLIIAGGPCCANAEPVAPFFDLICAGDGEEILPKIADLYTEYFAASSARDKGKSREGFLLACSKIPGVYAPGFYIPVFDLEADKTADTVPVFSRFEKVYEDLPETIGRAAVESLESAFLPEMPLVSHIESVHDRVSVEIMRGCYRKCRFCQASYASSEVRRRSPELVKTYVKKCLANTGYDEVTLLSLSTGDYPGIEELVTGLMQDLAGLNAVLSMPSLRFDSLKEDTLKKIAEYKRSGLTFAPEAGSQRLRDIIGKQLTEDDIFRALDICIPLGFTKFKFYFMIGLPGETYEDIDAIADLAGKTKNHVRKLSAEKGIKYQFNLSVSVSNFVPKPGTPFENVRGNSEEELIAKIHHLKDAVRKIKGAGFKYHDTRMSRVEMLLAKGDRRLSEVIRTASENGTGFDSWREHFSYDNWLNAFKTAGLPPEDLYSENSVPDGTGTYPWSIIEKGKAYG